MAIKKTGMSGIFGYCSVSRFGLILGLAIGFLLQTGCQSTPEADLPVPAKAAEPAAPVPTISFAGLVHDFGEISPRSKHVCEFRFKNTGTATLRLKPKIGSTCGCTVPMLNRVNYGPGQSGVIKVTYSAGTSIGSIKKTMTVHCNDPAQTQVKLTIKAKIVQKVVCEPQKLALRLKDANAACPSIALRSQDGVSFSITKVTSSGTTMTAAFDPNVQAQSFMLQPIVDLEKLEKRLVGYLLVDVTHPECRQVRIQYSTLREYQFKPAYVMAFNMEPNEPATKEVLLTNNYGDDFDIQSVSSLRGIVELVKQEKQTSEGKQGGAYRLELSLTPPANLKRGRMFVDVLSLQLSNGKVLKLNCRGVYSRTGGRLPSGTAPIRRR
jgi:hypothetical protein